MQNSLQKTSIVFSVSLDQKIIVTIIAAGCKAENIPMNKRNVYNPASQPQQMQQMGGMPQRNAGFVQPRPIQPQPQGPISQVVPPRPAPQPQPQQPVQPMRIDSTQGGGVNNETPSFMKRFLGRKRDNR